MNDRHYPTDEEKKILINLYKCHFTAMETAEQVPFGYQTVLHYFKGFRLLGIKKYNRLDLMETNNDARISNQ